MTTVLNEISDLLSTHPNRDKVVCLFQYLLKLWGSNTSNKALLTASARLTGARAVMRVLDTPAALRLALNHGLGSKEGPLWGTVGGAACLSSLGYLHAETVLFLFDSGILKLSSEDEYKVRTAHKFFWSLSSTIGLIKSLRTLYEITQEMKSETKPKCASERFVQASLTTAKGVLDVVHSVSWLPQGWLWGGRLTASQGSAAATVSAVLALVIHYNGKRLATR